MGRLTDRDTRALLGFLQGVYSNLSGEAFIQQAAGSLRRVVPADRCSYNEMHPERGYIRLHYEPESEATPQLVEVLRRYAHQNPVLGYFRRTRRAEVRTFSDVLSPSRFHRLPLYAEYYRYLGVEHQIIVPLSIGTSPESREIGFALNRQGRDFSSRDRLMLELIRPHLIQAWASGEAIARERARSDGLERALEEHELGGVILLDAVSRPYFIGRRGRALLTKYFDGYRESERLPDLVARWVKTELAALVADGPVPHPRGPLVRERDGHRLSVRLLGCNGERMLLLEERSLTLDPARLAPLGLTSRESQVLACVCDGKTNAEIAMILSARPATVAKHLEHIYAKLGVESRTAAAARALSETRPGAGGA